MRQSLMRKMILAVAAMSIVTTGCFGSFQMTRNVYSWNEKVGEGNKWSKELVFLLIGPIVPVYGVAVFLDAVFINSVEFWSGKNPMMSSLKVTDKDGTKVAQSLKADETGRTEVITVTDAKGLVRTTTMFQATGSPVITATTTYGDGRVETKSVTVDEVAALASSASHTR